MEETGKQDFIENLYELRAGISLISQGKDAICQCGKDSKEEYDAYFEKFLKDRGSVTTCHGLIGYFNDGVTYEKIQEEGLVAVWDKKSFPEEEYARVYSLQDYKNAVGALDGWTRREQKRGVFAVVCIVLAIISVFVALKFSPFAYIATALFGLCAIIFFIKLIIDFPCITYNRKRVRMLHEYPLWKQGIDAIFSNMETAIAPLIGTNNALYEVLRNRYAKILDERDWQYLDLIIYYLETGRADTKKEALLLVENEVQTQKIIQAVQHATSCICNTVHAAAQRISSQLSVISQQCNEIACMQAIQIQQTNCLIKEGQMQNALIAKANVTSSQLMYDVHRIRNYINP